MRKTPQEKKRQSLAKDRRYAYGNSPHAARKSVPRAKRIRAHAERRAAKVQVSTVTEDSRAIDLATARAEQKRKRSWKKISDAPLGLIVEGNLSRRKELLTQPRKRTSK